MPTRPSSLSPSSHPLVRTTRSTLAALSAAAISLVALLPAAPARAASPAKLAYATRAEWHACLDDADKLKQEETALNKRFDAHNAEILRWQATIRAHVASQSQLDTSDQAAVDAYNAQIEAHNARITALNAQGESLEKLRDAHNAGTQAANQRCAGLLITRADRDAVLRERAARTKPP